VSCKQRRRSCLLEELRLGERLLGQPGGLLVIVLGFRVRGQGGRAFGGPREAPSRERLDVGRVGCVGIGLVRIEVVGRDDLDDLLLPGRPDLLQIPRRSEMALLAVLARQRLVGDPLQQILEEGVLAALGRAGIRLEGKDLLAHESRDDAVELLAGEARQRREPLAREALAENRRILDKLPLLRPEAVEARGRKRVQRLGNVEALHLPGERVALSLALEQPAVEEHPHGLDGVQRNALGSVEDLCAQAVRKAGSEPVEERHHGRARERLEGQRRRVPPGAPAAPALGQLGPCQGEDEQRMVPRPVEEVLDEIEQRGVGPLEVLEDQHGRMTLGEALEEEPPGREEVAAVGSRPLGEPDQMRQAWLQPDPFVRVGDVLLDRAAELGERRLGRLLLGDACPHAHHLRQRPVRDAVAVGQAPAPVPEHAVREAVDVLEELPGQP
jgi:hypothetical protein